MIAWSTRDFRSGGLSRFMSICRIMREGGMNSSSCCCICIWYPRDCSCFLGTICEDEFLCSWFIFIDVNNPRFFDDSSIVRAFLSHRGCIRDTAIVVIISNSSSIMVIQLCGRRGLLFKITKQFLSYVKNHILQVLLLQFISKLPSRLIATIVASSASLTIPSMNFTETLLLAFVSSMALVRVLSDACKRRISLLG